MADYDFRGLSPFDFEVLCHDLFEPELGVKLQAFATGRDKGIDLRHAVANDNTLIVQCKHYANSGFKSLLSSVKNRELPKIQNLKPKRYILATTVNLTPGNVDQLFDLLKPYCVSKHDIIGATSLNMLLQKYPEVEKANFKLWLTSTAVLQRVLNAGVFFASDRTIEQIRDRLGMFVETAAMRPAKDQLERKKVCILSGNAGVGKTTLAEILIAQHLEKGWQLVVIDRNMEEAEKLFDPNLNVKQLFYYDDFLGQISAGEKLGKNEDRALLRMIETVKRTRNRRFLLTTREYILARAKESHERLARSEIDLLKFFVACEQYSAFDKAKILANHLFFAHVPQDHIATIVSNRTYNTIINHENYNPRIIELMTKTSKVNGTKPSEYPRAIIKALDNPAEIWLHAFENQISEASRHLVLTLASCGDGIVLADLQKAFESFFLKRAATFQFPSSPLSFEKSLFELEDSFIRITARGEERIVSFQNPSVLDFVKNWLLSHTSHAWDLLDSVITFEQAERLLAVLDFVNKVVQGSPDDIERACSILQQKLSSPSLRLMRRTHVFYDSIDDFSIEWMRESSSHWNRLLACCQFLKMLPSSSFQGFVLEALSTTIAQTKICNESIWGKCFSALSHTYNITPPDWYENQTLSMFDRILSCSLDSVEELQSFSELARWIEFNREILPEEKVSSASERIRERVVELTELQLDQNDPSSLGNDLGALNQIRRNLNIDLSAEVHSFEEEIEKWREPEEPESERSGAIDRDDREIESLFRVLVE